MRYLSHRTKKSMPHRAFDRAFDAAVDPHVAETSDVFVLGSIFALGKVLLSVFSGVYGESRFKAFTREGQPPQLHEQMVQISFSSFTAACLGYCVICWEQGQSVYTFFSGPDGSWDGRTLLVAFMYSWREWMSNICVKRFDNVVKQMCNVVSLMVTYVFVVFVTKERPFAFLKVALLIAIVAEVSNYAVSKRLKMVPGVDERKVDMDSSCTPQAPTTTVGNVVEESECRSLLTMAVHRGKEMLEI